MLSTKSDLFLYSSFKVSVNLPLAHRKNICSMLEFIVGIPWDHAKTIYRIRGTEILE